MGRQGGTTVFLRRAGVGTSPRMLLMAGSAVLALAVTGCSISVSSTSDSSSSFKWSSESSSSSSKSSNQKESYQNDVRDYTEAYARSSNDPAGFRSGLASVAQKHGITNWEADQATYTGIGQGLGKAQVNQSQLEVYKTDLAGGDAARATAMQEGYDQYKKE